MDQIPELNETSLLQNIKVESTYQLLNIKEENFEMPETVSSSICESNNKRKPQASDYISYDCKALKALDEDIE